MTAIAQNNPLTGKPYGHELDLDSLNAAKRTHEQRKPCEPEITFDEALVLSGYTDPIFDDEKSERGITITNVGEAWEELVEKIREVLTKCSMWILDDDSGYPAIHGVTFPRVATEIAALMQNRENHEEYLNNKKGFMDMLLKYGLAQSGNGQNAFWFSEEQTQNWLDDYLKNSKKQNK